MSRFYSEYAPKSLSEVVLRNPDLNRIFNNITNGASTNMIFYGTVGSGKTALAKLITGLYYSNRNESDCTKFIDLTQTYDLDVLNAAIMLSPLAFSDRWWFILDECDKIPSSKSTVLLNGLHNIIGKYNHCSFILTTNNLGCIPPGIQSRCYPVAIEGPSPEQFLPRARQIVAAEGKAATDAQIMHWLSLGKHDLRNYLTMLELNL